MSKYVRARKILLVGTIASVSFVLGILVRTTPVVSPSTLPAPSGIYTAAMYERIKPGMTRDAVEQIMGRAPVREVVTPQPPWYIDVGGEYHYSIPESRAVDVVHWSDGLCAVEVIYCNDLVLGKTLVSVRRGRNP